MKKAGFFILVVAQATLLCAGPTFANEKFPEATRIVISTSGPVTYRHVSQSNPPQIIFRFFHHRVYSALPAWVPIQKGIVKEIRATYFKNDASLEAKKPLRTLTYQLVANAPYEVFENPNAIILVIHHPKEMQRGLKAGRVRLNPLPPTTSEEARKVELTEALQEAMTRSVPPHSPIALPKQNVTFWALLLFLAGSLLGSVSWFLTRRRLLREQKRSWEMAKRIIALKEESVGHEEEAISLRKSLQNIEAEIRSLIGEKAKLKREAEIRTVYLDEMATERLQFSDRLRALQSELDEKVSLQDELLSEFRALSSRLDQELSERRRLEMELEELKKEKEEKVIPEESGEERRRWTRLPILPLEKKRLPITIEVQGPGGRLLYGYPKNVSRGGISFELKENIELPDSFPLTLLFAKRQPTLQAQGKVVWKSQEGASSHYGISFTNLPQEGTAVLSQFVKEKLPSMRQVRSSLEELWREELSGKASLFSFEAPQAQSVSLVGDFNDWNPQTTPMRKTKEGVWKTSFSLASGTYQYQFYVDGSWQTDSSAKERISNPFGGENALLKIE